MAHHIAGNCSNQVWWWWKHGAREELSRNYLILLRLRMCTKDDLQTESTWASMDALESIITPIFLAVDVATTWWSPIWSVGDTMPRAIDFDEMTRNYVLSFIFSSCDSIHFCTDTMHFSNCQLQYQVLEVWRWPTIDCRLHTSDTEHQAGAVVAPMMLCIL